MQDYVTRLANTAQLERAPSAGVSVLMALSRVRARYAYRPMLIVSRNLLRWSFQEYHMCKKQQILPVQTLC